MNEKKKKPYVRGVSHNAAASPDLKPSLIAAAAEPNQSEAILKTAKESQFFDVFIVGEDKEIALPGQFKDGYFDIELDDLDLATRELKEQSSDLVQMMIDDSVDLRAESAWQETLAQHTHQLDGASESLSEGLSEGLEAVLSIAGG